MYIKSTSAGGNFEITNDHGERLLELTYSNWFASDARTSFDAIDIHIKPGNIWLSKFNILKNEAEKGDIAFNWKGNVIIKLKIGNKIEKQYLLKAIGFWKMVFELLDDKERKILSMKPNFSWKKASYDYEVELANHANYQKENKETIELLIYAGFGANLYMSMMMGE